MEQSEEKIVLAPSNTSVRFAALDKLGDSPFSKSPFFPDDSIINTKRTIIKNRYYYLNNSLRNYDDFEQIDSKDKVMSALSQLREKAKKIEREHDTELESLCKELLYLFFKEAKENIIFNPSLVEEVSPINGFRVKPEYGEKEYEDVSEASSIMNLIETRKIINTLIEGGSYDIVMRSDDFISKVHRIHPELPILYMKIMLLDELYLFIDDSDIDEKSPNCTGIVEVTFNGEGNNPTVDAQGTLFIYLLQQSIKGLLEVFASHGLPDDKNKAMYILNQTECLEYERWYKRFGVPLWQILFDNQTIDTNNLSYYVMNLSKMNFEEMKKSLQEVFSTTKRGKEICTELVNKAKHDSDYSDFEERIIQKNKAYEEKDELSLEELRNFSF